MRRNWTDQEILDALKYWAERYGRSPKWEDWEKGDPEGLRPTSITVLKRCGSFTDALLMAGLEPNAHHFHTPELKFDRGDARRLRNKGLSDRKIGELLGVHASSIAKALGPRPKPPRRPRTAAEKREARIAALQKALKKNH